MATSHTAGLHKIQAAEKKAAKIVSFFKIIFIKSSNDLIG